VSEQRNKQLDETQVTRKKTNDQRTFLLPCAEQLRTISLMRIQNKRHRHEQAHDNECSRCNRLRPQVFTARSLYTRPLLNNECASLYTWRTVYTSSTGRR